MIKRSKDQEDSQYANLSFDEIDCIPTEYAAMQSIFTATTKLIAGRHNQPIANLTPIDNNTFTRFLGVAAFPSGDVPRGNFNPDAAYRQV
ncbi:MAG: hypothetical protein COV60_03305 [Candidatus Magasanikbacteria bacterium CG11_big_fil_rev_8_21_14_0_20_43_7]|uniref:Uncharacterized protein n=1 Tax=Candidatus Magasanikbacteria bacterium CG11_big_fil_rev_8_21_14_0_20_43_7 TaxID=1974654 RepID=A0A2H0N1W8_9BACT|nr:MAG: hypothetical protein COV60_03305 [Candidatus Magasanikbacteria bacterium CG11_big_fil_rev_8_21_14_0_20_43_7]